MVLQVKVSYMKECHGGYSAVSPAAAAISIANDRIPIVRALEQLLDIGWLELSRLKHGWKEPSRGDSRRD